MIDTEMEKRGGEGSSFGVEREEPSERVSEEIEDDLTALRQEQQRSPLSFCLRVGDSYCCSLDWSKGIYTYTLAPNLLGRFCLMLPVIFA